MNGSTLLGLPGFQLSLYSVPHDDGTWRVMFRTGGQTLAAYAGPFDSREEAEAAITKYGAKLLRTEDLQ